MNGFFISLLVIGGILFFICFAHILWLVGCGMIFRDNGVFENKYKRKKYPFNFIARIRYYKKLVNLWCDYMRGAI